MSNLSNTPEIGLEMMGFSRFTAQQSTASRVFTLIDHNQESINQIVIVDKQDDHKTFLQNFFHSRSNTLIDACPAIFNLALKEQKMWIWSFQTAMRQLAFMPKLKQVTFGQVVTIGAMQSNWVCLPCPSEWMHSPETKARYWRDYQELFCT